MGTIEYIVLLVFFIMFAWFVLVYYVHDEKERKTLFTIFLLALALRIVVALLVHALIKPGFFAPDEPGIIYNGKGAADLWVSSGSFYARVDSPATAAEIIFYLFGFKPAILFLFVNFLGALTVLNIYFIARRLFNVESARYSALVVAVLPSLVLWSSIASKDPYTQFLISFAVHLLLRIKERFRIGNVILLLSSIALIAFFRRYLLVIVVLGALSMLIPYRKKTFVRDIIIIAIFGFAAAALSSSYSAKSLLSTGASGSVLEQLQETRSAFYQGGSKMLGHINVANPVDAVMYSPLLLAVFFLAPFPWDISASIIHNLATAESLVWYYFLFYALKGIKSSLKEGKFDIMPVVVMIGVLSVAYALALTNIGAAYRFRAQVSVLLLTFSGYGIYVRNRERIKKHSM